jgi:hypothetical protein
MMKKMRLALAAAVIAVATGMALYAQGARPPLLQVYKDPTCGCCAKWVEHMKNQGFAANVSDVEDINAVKDANGVPQKLRSCHTATVDGYVIEGHVPAADVQRLLQERPAGVVGLTVPGMPVGSPGMEVGNRVQPYEVLTFDKDGRTHVFASHGR